MYNKNNDVLQRNINTSHSPYRIHTSLLGRRSRQTLRDGASVPCNKISIYKG